MAGRPWSFDADGRLFRLASEARRIHLAWMFDPLLAVQTSMLEPLPHQIDAVYRRMLGCQPLRFLRSNKLRDRFLYSFRLVPPRRSPLTHRPRPRSCDPAYRGACLKPGVSDYDCAGGDGNGPYYVRGPIEVVGDDHCGLDSDGDGVACES